MSDLINRFAENTHRGGLTQLGQGLGTVIAQRRAAEAERVRMEKYGAIKAEYTKTKDPTLIPQLQEIAPEKFEGNMKAWAAMDAETQQQSVQLNAEVLGLLDQDMPEQAIERLDKVARSHEADGEVGDANVVRSLIQKIEQKDYQAVDDFLTLANSAIPIGQKVNASRWALNEDKRADVASQGRLFQIIQENSWSSEEDKVAFADSVEGYGLETAQMLGELASVMSVHGKDGAMTSDQFGKAEAALRKEYDSYIGDYMKAIQGSETIAALSRMDSGFADQGMIMLFNKVLDPPSVVRESEARMTADNQSVLNKGRTLLSNLKEGDRLSPEARKQLTEAVQLMGGLAKDRKAEEKDRIMKTVDYYGFGEDRIFMADDEAPEGTNVQRTQDINEAILAKYPGEEDNLTGMTEAEKFTKYSSALSTAGYTQAQVPQGQPAVSEVSPADTGSLQEYIIKQGGYTGEQAAQIRRTSDARLTELNPGTAQAWKDQQGATPEAEPMAPEVETEAASIIANSPVDVEPNLVKMQAAFANMARNQSKSEAEINQILRSTPAQLKADYPEQYATWAKKYPEVWATAEVKSLGASDTKEVTW